MKSPAGDGTFRRDTFLKVLFAVLIFFILANVALGFASLPEYYERVGSLRVGVILAPDGELLVSDAMIAESARERGMTVSVYALYQVFLVSVNTLVLGVLAGIVLWKARRDWFGWFTACVILVLGTYTLAEATWVAGLLPFWILDSGVLLWLIYPLYFFLFPNGRSAPQWAKPVIGVFFAIQFALQSIYFAGTISPELLSQGLKETLNVSTIALIFVYMSFVLGCQVYRYRRVSSIVERQQTKWFLLGLAFILLTWPFVLVWDFPLEIEFFFVTVAILPINIAVAMLRYRLFDVDTLINRALVYGSLTISLAAIYLGSVVLLQSSLVVLIGGASQINIVISTLLIAALFVPLRRVIQRFIDRRFYRQKYDARRTLDEFSKRLRDETDLENLANDLLFVVRDTMRPEYAGLWLRRDLDARKGEAR